MELKRDQPRHVRAVLTVLCHFLSVLEHTDTNIMWNDVRLNLDSVLVGRPGGNDSEPKIRPGILGLCLGPFVYHWLCFETHISLSGSQ